MAAPAKERGAKTKLKAAPGRTQSASPPTEHVAINFSKTYYQQVPAGKKYAVIDAQGRTVASFSAGQKTTMTTDCAQVTCPDPFGKDTVCWKCVERIKAK